MSRGVLSRIRWVIKADLEAMAEGESLTPGRVLLRVLVHGRWRAIPCWRVAQASMAYGWARPFTLWLTDRILRMCGAELAPASRIGPGVVLKHTSGLVVGHEVVAGARLTLHQNVTLGDRRPCGGQPSIGDDVTVGAGACVLGPVSIGDRVVIGANSVVLSDVPSDCTVVGSPARVVRHEPGSHTTQSGGLHGVS